MKSYTACVFNPETEKTVIIVSEYETMEQFKRDLQGSYTNIKIWTTEYFNKMQDNGGQRRSYTPQWKKELYAEMDAKLNK
jgi:hypothetical protein